MAHLKYLSKRPGSDKYYYRRTVPTDIQTVLNKKVIWISLRTSDRETAKEAWREADEKVDAMFNSARTSPPSPPQPINTAQTSTTPTPSPPRLTPAQFQQLSDHYYLKLIDDEFARRNQNSEFLKTPLGPALNRFLGNDTDPLIFTQRQHQRFTTALTTADLTPVQKALDQHSLHPDDRLKLGRLYLETAIKASGDIIKGDADQYHQIMQSEDLPTESAQSQATAPVACLLSDHVLDYLEDCRTEQLPTKTIIAKQKCLREFIEICTDKPISDYTKSDGIKLKTTLIKLPKYARTSFPGRSLVEIATLDHGRPKLSITSINDKLGHVATFFNWAMQHDFISKNPVSGLQLKNKAKSEGRQRNPFTTDELVKIFHAPIFTGCVSDRNWSSEGDVVLQQSAKFWIPLIALFSGMRLGEIIQLRRCDIQQQDGIRFFDVVAAGDNMKLKTSTSKRKVPVHAELLKLGFVEFVEKRDGQIFPDFAHGERFDEKSGKDQWVDRFSKHFRRHLEAVGAKGARNSFHSFRHNFEDACRNCGVAEDVRNALQGHGENGVSRSYGSGFYVETLAGGIGKIGYDELDLGDLLMDERKGNG